ncbi:MAG: RsmB/NOP family class I SAM-dependent RNA methyltransferase [Candidatus Lokiarchaeota archaeon]|nr:RsmB/NOP family class I SAM-dependent RNA methyltransferase [Candidatus Lokiarchaeota archaeon]
MSRPSPPTFTTLIHPDARERLRFLDEIDGGGFEAYHEAISHPGSRYHVRANTMRARPAELAARLQRSHPDWTVALGGGIPEAIAIGITGPHRIDGVAKKVLADRFAAESTAMSAPLFAPGFKQPLARFRAGDAVGVVTRFTTSWDKQAHEVHCANGIAAYHSNVMHEPSSGVVVRTAESWYRSPPVQSWPEYVGGLIVDQNLPSMVAARALAPVEGDAVLDVCCGAGGKTTHVAQLMNGKGRIVAVDRSSGKVARLRERAARMGIDCITPVVARSERMGSAITPFRADRVLVDPPCSALGLRLKLSIDESRKDLDNYRANQARIIDNVMESGFVSEHTRIVYCTCTVAREENELLVADVVDKHGLEIADPGLDIGHPGVQVDRLSKDELSRLRRFYPHVDDTIGFFIATLVKP